MLSVAIVGNSGHAGFVLQGLRELGAVARLCAVAPGGADEELGGLRGQGVPVYDDYRQMLDAERPDIVAVTPHFYRHAAVSRAALEAGCAVFCEKPLALTREELADLRAVWQASGRPLGMMLNSRYIPAFYTARQLVRAGGIGAPVCGYAQKSYPLGARPAFFARRETFGGLIPWVGIHAIDWFQYVSGCRYTAVTAHHGNRNAPDYPGLEDYAACQFTLAGGGAAVMSFDYLRPVGIQPHGDDRLRLVGTEGILEIRDETLTLLTGEGARVVPPQSPPHGLFADFVHGMLAPAHRCLLSAEEAFAATEIALRAREAADSGQTISLGEDDV